MYGPVPMTGLPLSGGEEPGGTNPQEVASFSGSAGSGWLRRMVIVPVRSSVSMPLARLRPHVSGRARQAV